MGSSWIRVELYPRRIAATAACLFSCGLLLSAPLAIAQAPVQDAAPPPPASAPAPPATPPSVFESIGRFFDQSASDFRDHLRDAKRKMDEDAAANSKGFSENAAKVNFHHAIKRLRGWLRGDNR